jgi:hypothetical protein
MAPRYNKSIVCDAVNAIVSTFLRLRRRWVTSSTLAEALKQRYDVGDQFELILKLLSKAMITLVPAIDSLQQSSSSEIYRIAQL